MTRPAAQPTALAAWIVPVVVSALAVLAGCRGSGDRIDLLGRFAEAHKAPDAVLFSLIDAELNGERHRAVAVAPAPGSRLSWRVIVPRSAWLWVSIGMQPEAWTGEGDGVKFTATVTDGATTTPLFEQHLHPFASAGDRKWFPIRVSLAPYAGREVEVVFSTAASANGAGEDQRHDLPLWGVPEIVVR